MEWISPIFTAFAIVVFLIYEGYFKEKGKNLATKEDISEITNEIKKVESVYNNSLEKYKIELQKEYYSSKYIIDFCNKIDMQLIEKLINCITNVDNQMKYGFSVSEVDSIYYEIESVVDFMQKYSHRYSEVIKDKDIERSFNRLRYVKGNESDFDSMELGGEYLFRIQEIHENMSSVLSLLLPKLKVI